MTTELTKAAQQALPEITEEDRQFLHYNPNTSDLVEWVQNYALRAVAALTQRPAAQTERDAMAEEFEAMHANGDVWISTIAAAKLTRASLPSPQQATPEPVGEPVAWWYGTHPRPSIETIRLDHTFTDHAGEYIKGRPLVFGDTRPAPGVPEGWAIERRTDMSPTALVVRSPKNGPGFLTVENNHANIAYRMLYRLASDLLAAAQAKGM